MTGTRISATDGEHTQAGIESGKWWQMRKTSFISQMDKYVEATKQAPITRASDAHDCRLKLIEHFVQAGALTTGLDRHNA